MKILIFSPCGDGIGLAHQLEQEGHQVAIHYVEDFDAAQGEGMIWRSADWQVDARQADFVLFDNNSHGEKADNLRKRGVKVWCGGSVADRLEHDRPFGMAVMRKAKIPIPETFDFSNAAEARDTLKDQFKAADRSVVKINDLAAAATSYVSKDRADMLAQIDAWAETGAVNLDHGGILQRFVPGTEVSIEGWFNGERFMYPFNWTMEDKKLLAGNLGPNTGCAFSMSRNIRARDPKMARLFLDPLAPLLKAAGYTGQVDVNTIVSEEDGTPYALEFTPRPGYEGTSNLALTIGGYGNAIGRALGILEGDTVTDGAERPWDFSAALRLWVPPYPYECPEKPQHRALYKTLEGIPIGNMPTVEEGFVPYDVRKNDEGDPEMAGVCGIVGVTLAAAPTPAAAVARCTALAERIEVPNMGFRVDAGERIPGDLATVEHLLR